MTDEIQQVAAEAMHYANVLRDLTTPHFVEPQPTRRELATLTRVWADSVKRGLVLAMEARKAQGGALGGEGNGEPR